MEMHYLPAFCHSSFAHHYVIAATDWIRKLCKPLSQGWLSSISKRKHHTHEKNNAHLECRPAAVIGCLRQK